MIKGVIETLLFSDDASKLGGFYRDKVGLKVSMEGEMGDNNEPFYVFESDNGVSFGVMNHSEVKGKNPQPQRIIFNIEVDDIEKEVKRLDSQGVKKIKDIYHIQDYGQVATFEDIDGNYFQLVQIREISEKN